MESARNKHSGKLIEAQLLPELSYVSPYDYICWGCNIVVTPCSYRAHNKKRPYFRPTKEHERNCETATEKEWIEKAKKGSIATKDGFPLSFPSKLQLEDTPSVTIPNSNASTVKRKSSSEQHGANDVKKKNHHYTVTTIRPICRQFLNYPFDRYLSLEIPHISGKNYQDVFWRLNEIIKYYKQQIFYAPLSWAKASDAGDYLEIYLNAGKWDHSKKKA